MNATKNNNDSQNNEENEHWYHIEVSQKNPGALAQKGRVAYLIEPENPNFPKLTIQSPAIFKGPADENNRSLYWTPEHLFVAAVTTCIFTTLITVSENSHFTFKDVNLKAKGKIGEDPEFGRMITEIIGSINLTIDKDASEKRALRILQLVKKRCLISHSVRTKLNFELNVRKEE
ncbi:MAG: OsmC family protein [Promethearchaeota archaeon]